MSGEGPESVPTSEDPRSHRPTKKRALSPSSAHAASLDALFARPDQDIRIPADGANKRRAAGAAPPEIVANVQGSSAGAGSGEFHVYKASRRREYERLRDMENEASAERAKEEFERGKEEREKMDEERTRKNREKREKAKARKAKKGKGGGNAAAPSATGKQQSRDDAEDGSDTRDDGRQDGQSRRRASTPPREAQNGSSAAPAGLVIHDDD